MSNLNKKTLTLLSAVLFAGANLDAGVSGLNTTQGNAVNFVPANFNNGNTGAGMGSAANIITVNTQPVAQGAQTPDNFTYSNVVSVYAEDFHSNSGEQQVDIILGAAGVSKKLSGEGLIIDSSNTNPYTFNSPTGANAAVTATIKLGDQTLTVPVTLVNGAVNVLSLTVENGSYLSSTVKFGQITGQSPLVEDLWKRQFDALPAALAASKDAAVSALAALNSIAQNPIAGLIAADGSWTNPAGVGQDIFGLGTVQTVTFDAAANSIEQGNVGPVDTNAVPNAIAGYEAFCAEYGYRAIPEVSDNQLRDFYVSIIRGYVHNQIFSFSSNPADVSMVQTPDNALRNFINNVWVNAEAPVQGQPAALTAARAQGYLLNDVANAETSTFTLPARLNLAAGDKVNTINENAMLPSLSSLHTPAALMALSGNYEAAAGPLQSFKQDLNRANEQFGEGVVVFTDRGTPLQGHDAFEAPGKAIILDANGAPVINSSSNDYLNSLSVNNGASFTQIGYALANGAAPLNLTVNDNVIQNNGANVVASAYTQVVNGVDMLETQTVNGETSMKNPTFRLFSLANGTTTLNATITGKTQLTDVLSGKGSDAKLALLSGGAITELTKALSVTTPEALLAVDAQGNKVNGIQTPNNQFVFGAGTQMVFHAVRNAQTGAVTVSLYLVSNTEIGAQIEMQQMQIPVANLPADQQNDGQPVNYYQYSFAGQDTNLVRISQDISTQAFKTQINNASGVQSSTLNDLNALIAGLQAILATNPNNAQAKSDLDSAQAKVQEILKTNKELGDSRAKIKDASDAVLKDSTEAEFKTAVQNLIDVLRSVLGTAAATENYSSYFANGKGTDAAVASVKALIAKGDAVTDQDIADHNNAHAGEGALKAKDSAEFKINIAADAADGKVDGNVAASDAGSDNSSDAGSDNNESPAAPAPTAAGSFSKLPANAQAAVSKRLQDVNASQQWRVDGNKVFAGNTVVAVIK